MVGVLLLAICISVSAVSAEDGSWSFDFSSSDSTNSDGGSVQVDNNVVTIQGFKFTIPDGFKENESAKKVGEEADQELFPDFKESTVAFDKGDDRYLITVLFGDEKVDDDSYTPAKNATEKELADVDGWYEEYDDGAAFDYIEDGKLIHIFAPNEKGLISLLESAED